MHSISTSRSSTGASSASSSPGFEFSLQLTLIAMIGGIVIGTLLALMRLSSQPWLPLATVYVEPCARSRW